jgi:hypothetical protein
MYYGEDRCIVCGVYPECMIDDLNVLACKSSMCALHAFSMASRVQDITTLRMIIWARALAGCAKRAHRRRRAQARHNRALTWFE